MKKTATQLTYIHYKIESVFTKDIIEEIKDILADKDINASGKKQYFEAMLETMQQLEPKED